MCSCTAAHTVLLVLLNRAGRGVFGAAVAAADAITAAWVEG